MLNQQIVISTPALWARRRAARGGLFSVLLEPGAGSRNPITFKTELHSAPAGNAARFSSSGRGRFNLYGCAEVPIRNPWGFGEHQVADASPAEPMWSTA